MTPEALVLLANLGRPRRPSGAAMPWVEPVLPDAAAAERQLAGVVDLADRPIADVDLTDLRQLQRVATQAAEAIVAGERPDFDELNSLARSSIAHLHLAVGDDGSLVARLVWEDPAVAGGLARRLVAELAAVQPDRLRRCARPECDLVFYDTTRPGTRRWHAEDPCGWRERQRRRRATSG